MDQRQQDKSRQAFGYLRSYGDSYTGFETHDSTTGWAGLGQRENFGKALEVFFNHDGRQISSVIFCNDPDAMADDVEAFISKHFGNKPTTESKVQTSFRKMKSLSEVYHRLKSVSLTEGAFDFPEMVTFLDNLRKNADAIKLGEHYGVDMDRVIKELKLRISVNRYRDGRVKRIWIDFTDTKSGIRIKHSENFN